MLGTFLFWAEIALSTILLAFALLWKRNATYPVLCGYLAANIAASVILFPLAYRARWDTYSAIYPLTRPILLALALGACAEVVRRAYRLEGKHLEMAAFCPPIVLFIHPSVDLDRGLRFLCCLLLLAVVPKLRSMETRDVAVAAGLLLDSFCPALFVVTAIQWRANWVQYSSTVAFLLALGIWMRAFRTQAQSHGIH